MKETVEDEMHVLFNRKNMAQKEQRVNPEMANSCEWSLVFFSGSCKCAIRRRNTLRVPLEENFHLLWPGHCLLFYTST